MMKQKLSFLCVWPLPAALTLPERTDLLHQFGAVEVQHITRRGKVQAATAGFKSFSDCQIAISRLHQLDVLGNRLHAVLWDQPQNKPLSGTAESSSDQTELSVLQQEQAQLTALSAQLGLMQPLLPHARYKYPEPSPKIIANLANALVAVPKFYTQVLHLMNKMNLPEPFSAALPPSKLVRLTAAHITSLCPEGSDGSEGAAPGAKEQPAKASDDASREKESVLLCNACKKILKKRHLDTGDDAVTTTTEQLREDVLPSSSTSESELESDQEQQIEDHQKRSLSLEQIQAIKRSRKPNSSQAAGSRKKARLQLEQEKKFLQHDSTQTKSLIDKCSSASVSDAFRRSVATVQSAKLQLNIPMSLSATSDKERQAAAPAPDDAVTQERHHRLEGTRRKDTLCEASHHRSSISKEQDNEPSDGDNTKPPVNEAGTGFGKLEAKKASEVSSQLILSAKYISLEELESNRVKISEYPVVPVLANYSPGTPSSRLYIKNLAKSVTEQHLRRLYDRYAYAFYAEQQRRHDEPLDITANPDKYHVRVLQEGRMKGQAFVTLPSTELAEQARQHTNGFILQDKPMVVAFARVKAGPT